jgi:hypothetical protein
LWRAYPEEGCDDTGWLTGLWSTQAKVEGIVLKAAWHWGRESRTFERLEKYIWVPFLVIKI